MEFRRNHIDFERCPRHTALLGAIAPRQSEPLRERVAREPRTRTGSFCFSTVESRAMHLVADSTI